MTTQVRPRASRPTGRTLIDLDLVRKYSIPGPRYTSYPPATRFSSELLPLELERAIAENNAPGAGPLSLYFHLPFCESLCWFCGCNTVITRRRESADDYVADLVRELKIVTARMDVRRPVAQIHLGGGTPTFLPPDTLRRLGDALWEFFPQRTSTCEFSVEVDPRRVTEDHVIALQAMGAHRASLGVQDTDDRVQQAIHRIQPMEVNRRAFAWLREHGFRSINVDLIYGLPLQSPASFARTIEDVLSLDPDRLSVFSYAHVPWIKPSQRIFDDRTQLPDPEAKLAMFATAHEKLTAAGYIDIGLDHFARPSDELARALENGTLQRNFQGYSTGGGTSLYGFGVSSISSIGGTYRQNWRALPAWRSALDRGELPIERGLRLTEEDERRRTIILRLMCERRLDFASLSDALDVDFASTYAAELASLEDLENDGIVQRDAEGLTVTRVGVPLLRVVAMRFDATLAPTGTEGRHSRTV